jgi:hypothetical protein
VLYDFGGGEKKYFLWRDTGDKNLMFAKFDFEDPDVKSIIRRIN